jgi:hypothetical protein
MVRRCSAEWQREREVRSLVCGSWRVAVVSLTCGIATTRSTGSGKYLVYDFLEDINRQIQQS